MQIQLELKDESKLDSLLEMLANFGHVEVQPSKNGASKNGAVKKKKKFTPAQQEFIDGLKESLEAVELHIQGKIRLKSWEEFQAELELEREMELAA